MEENAVFVRLMSSLKKEELSTSFVERAGDYGSQKDKIKRETFLFFFFFSPVLPCVDRECKNDAAKYKL